MKKNLIFFILMGPNAHSPLGRGGNIYFFFIIRDKTFKHKYKYFHIHQRYFLNLYISENIHRDKQLFKLVKVLVYAA